MIETKPRERGLAFPHDYPIDRQSQLSLTVRVEFKRPIVRQPKSMLPMSRVCRRKHAADRARSPSAISEITDRQMAQDVRMSAIA